MTSRQRLGLSASLSQPSAQHTILFSPLFFLVPTAFPSSEAQLYLSQRDKYLSGIAQCEYRKLPSKGTKIHLLFRWRVLTRTYGLGYCERDCECPGTAHIQKILTSPTREVSHLQSCPNAWGTRFWTNARPLPNFPTVQLFRSPRVQLLIARARQHRWKRVNTNSKQSLT